MRAAHYAGGFLFQCLKTDDEEAVNDEKTRDKSTKGKESG